MGINHYNNFAEFLGIGQEELQQQTVIVKDRICTPHLFLYGGAGLSLSVEMLQRIYNRPLIWATTQFAGQAHPGNLLRFKDKSLSAGKNFTQANIEAHVDNVCILNTNASLGYRDSEFSSSQIIPPDNIDSPNRYKSINFPEKIQKHVMGQFEIRNVRGPEAFSITADTLKKTSGASIFWARFAECAEISASSLAFLSDIAPSITSAALGKFVMARSLDNSIRIVEIKQSNWILCEANLQATQNGVGHITQHMWTENGDLLAIASQSYILKSMDDGLFSTIK